MKSLIVSKSKIANEMSIPSSKSQTHRAILLGTLAKDFSIVHNPLMSPDTYAMIEACRNFGAKIDVIENQLSIKGLAGNISESEDVVQAYNSGIVLRFVSAVAALASKPIVITGDYSIRHQRPMQPILDALQELGARAESTRGDGFAPLIIQGPLQAGKCTIKNGADSQNVSAFLIAAAFLKGTTELLVQNPGEKPWIDITLDWLKRLGVSYENHAYAHYIVHGGKIPLGFEYHVPGDWSSAAFPLAAALVTQSEIILKNLDMHDLQGDKKILEIFSNMGASFSIDYLQKTVRLHAGAKLKGIKVDVNECIDAIAILAAVACYADGETHLTNAAIARQKECDRLKGMTMELNKMGANVRETADGLIIQGAPLRGNVVNGHHDHRVAMSLAIAALGAEGQTQIFGTECISKTYPNFVRDFQTAGASIKEVP